MAPVVKLVDRASDATLLFNFNEPAGTGNPNSLKTVIMGDPDFGTIPQNPVFFEPEDSPGGTLAKSRHGLVQMAFKFRPEATTSDNLFAAIGKLGQYLDNPREYALFIQLDGWAEKRYADIVLGAIPALLRGRERGLFEVSTLLKDPQGIEVLLWRQPTFRGPTVTVGPTTVPNDPADASGRFIEVTNAGTAPAPAAVKVAGDTGAKVQEIVIARKSAFPYANTRVTDYTGGTQYGQLNADANGWDNTLTNDTTDVDQTAQADASGNRAAQTTHATDPTVMKKRVRMTRTANTDSLRGTFKIVVRVKNTAAAKHVLQARWSHSLADPATFSEQEVIHDTIGLAAFAYVDVDLGRISVPQGHMLGGLALEFWSRRDSGSGNLMWDFVSLVPADESLSTIVVPRGSTDQWLGSQLVTPLTDPSGGTAGAVEGTSLSLDHTTDNAGTPPAGGSALAAGVHRWTFDVENQSADPVALTFRVRRIGAPGTTVAERAAVSIDPGRRNYSIEYTVADGSSYEGQVDDPNAAEKLVIYSVSRQFQPVIASGEEAHSDPTPGYQLLHKMDASDNIVMPLNVEGPLPLWLQPGLNCIYVQYAEVPITSGAPGGESKLTRDCAVTISYSPRYLN